MYARQVCLLLISSLVWSCSSGSDADIPDAITGDRDATVADARVIPDATVLDDARRESDAARAYDTGLPDGALVQNGEDSWVTGYSGLGGDAFLNVATDPAGNAYVAGQFAGEVSISGTTIFSNGELDVVIASYSKTGSFRWATTLGGGAVETVGGIAVDEQGNSYVTLRFSDKIAIGGHTTFESKGQSDALLVSYDRGGTFRWAKQFGGQWSEGPRDVAVGAGRVCIVGDLSGGFSVSDKYLSGFAGYEPFVICVASGDGQVQWAHAYAGQGSDIGTAVAVGPQGQVTMAISFDTTLLIAEGMSIEARGGFDSAYIEHDRDGKMTRFVHTGATDSDEITGIDVDAAGNVYITGVFAGSTTFGADEYTAQDRYDGFVAKFDASGNNVWSAALPGDGLVQPLDAEVGGGRVHVGGRFQKTMSVADTTFTSGGSFDAFLATFRTDGTAIGAWVVGGTGADQVNGVAPDVFGGAYVAGLHNEPITLEGMTVTPSGLSGAFVAHLSPLDIPDVVIR